MSRYYSAYNLTVASDIAMPELTTVQPVSDLTSDVTVRIGALPEKPSDDLEQIGPFRWANQTAYWLEIPEVARILVQNGSDILVDPAPDVDEASLRAFVLGPSFGAILHQRNLLVMHGNTIRLGDKCIICVGPSGAGKSTLSAGFQRRGYQVLADDVVPITAEGLALPGFPRIKLWQETADQLEIDTSPLQRIRPQLFKYNVPVTDAYVGPALPVRWVYILNSEHRDDVRIDELRGMARLQPLLDNTYSGRLVLGPAARAQQLRMTSQLASKIRLARITRPHSGFTVDAMVDKILADIAEHP